MTEPCVICADSVPDGPREGEGHISVRFLDIPSHVELDGTDVSRDCVEAMAGPDGWVLVYVWDEVGKYSCPTSRMHGYLVRRNGDVRIARTMALR